METAEQMPLVETQPIRKVTNTQSFATSAAKRTFSAKWNDHAADFEKTRFGWMAILITFQSCLGAAACMYILKNDASVFVLATCAALSMGSNALFIGLASPKVCLFGFYLSVLVNTIFLIMNVQI